MSKEKKSVPGGSVHRNSSSTDRIYRKLVADETNNHSVEISKKSRDNVVNETAQRINDSHALRQMLPDVEMIEQILVSSILSPQDLSLAELSYGVSGLFSKHPLAGEMTAVIERWFTDEYRINEDLKVMLQDALFRSGAHIRAVIPESEIDRIINSHNSISFESVSAVLDNSFVPKKNRGLIGPGRGETSTQDTGNVSLESFFNYSAERSQVSQTSSEKTLGLTVTDDYSVLFAPVLRSRLRSQKIVSDYAKNPLNLSMEAVTSVNNSKLDNTLKGSKKKEKSGEGETVIPTRTYDVESLVALTDPGLINVDKEDLATVLTLPTESVIPVFTPGNPSSHIGYWVVLENGHPVKKSTKGNHFGSLTSQLGTKNQVSGIIESTAREWFGASDFSSAEATEDENTRVYEKVIERELKTRLENGIYKDGVDISLSKDIAHMMLGRALNKKQTTMLFLPAEFVTYIAFDYDDNGIGISLVEATKIVGSIRSLMLFSGTMAMVRNAIGRTILNIEYDGNEADPEKVRDMALDAVIRGQHHKFPIGEANPSRLANYVQRAGIEVNTSGHPDMPETKISMENYKTDIQPPDDTSMESLKRTHHLGFGMSPDVVDEASRVNLATTAIRQDLLLSKRVLMYQSAFTPMVTRHIRMVTMYSGHLLEKLTGLIDSFDRKEEPEEFKGYSAEGLVGLFLESLETSLPRPDGSTTESQTEALDAHHRLVEMCVDWYLSSEMFTSDDMKELEYLIPNIRGQLIAHYMRRYMRQNNIMSDLDEILNFNEEVDDTNPQIMDELMAHVKRIENGVGKYFTEMNKLAFARELKQEREEEKQRKRREKIEEKRREEEEAEQAEQEALNNPPEEEEETTGGSPEEETPPEEETGGEEEEVGGSDEEGGQEEESGGDEFDIT